MMEQITENAVVRPARVWTGRRSLPTNSVRLAMLATKATARECLRCGRLFQSLGNYNRLCDTCNDANLNCSKRIERGGVRYSRSTGKGDEVQ